MVLLIELFSYFFISIGSILILIGSIGLLRLPDVFSRIHAVGMIDTAGIGFIIFGLLLHSGFSNTSIKLIINNTGIYLGYQYFYISQFLMQSNG